MARREPDVDFADIDDRRPTRPRREAPARGGSQTLRVARAMIWMACLLWTGAWSLFLVRSLTAKDISAVQESAVAAVACAAMMAGYVAARALTSATRELEV